MKPSALISILSGAALLFTGCATTRSTTTVESVTPSAVLTGSYLPQPLSLNNPIPNGVNNVSVITANEIRNTGAPTLPRALSRLGMSR